jgi:hypothetical protein
MNSSHRRTSSALFRPGLSTSTHEGEQDEDERHE